LSKETVAITFILRPANHTGYPPGDPEVFEFLLGCTTSIEIHSAMVAILGAALELGGLSLLLNLANTLLTPYIALGWLTTQSKKGQLAVSIKEWHTTMSPTGDGIGNGHSVGERRKFYKKLVDRARLIYKSCIGDDEWGKAVYNNVSAEKCHPVPRPKRRVVLHTSVPLLILLLCFGTP
jgi:hypothetical protein